LVGVFSADYAEPMATALRDLNCEKALVVHGAGGLDELSAAGKEANHVAALEDGVITMQVATVTADVHPDLRGGLATENAAEMQALLNGAGRPGHRAAVLINAAAALFVAGRAPNVVDAHKMAAEALDSGAARAALERLISVSRSAP
jgi:anthranilate phosphoribosyltransferase